MKYFFSLLILISSLSLKAQYPYLTVGPDDTLDCRTNCTTLHADYFHAKATNSYTVSQIPYTPFSFNSGTNIGLSADDKWSGLIAMPFPFCFMGSQYSSLVIGTNGIISFNQSYANGTCPWNLTGGETLPTDSFPTLSIMGPMQDMNSSDEGSIYIDTIGIPPARAFIISYYGMPYYSCIDSFLIGQVVLYETTNVIDIYIQSKGVCTGWNGGRAIEGIQKDGTLGYAVPGRNNSVWSATNDAWRFSPNALPNIARIAWYEGVSVIGSLDSVVVCPTTTTTYVAVVTYTPCGAGPPTVLRDTITIYASYLAVQQASVQNVTCFGNNDGYASVNVNGGSPPYTYLWTPSSITTNTASGLTAGAYTVTVTDTTTCYNTVNINVTQPPLLTLSDSAVATTCSTCNDGIIILNASGGTPSYLYSISPPAGNQIGGFFYNLPSGTYTACAVDMNGCDTCRTVVVDVTTGISSFIPSSQAVFFPNPFSTETTLKLHASSAGSLKLVITDVLGRSIADLTIDKETPVVTRNDIPLGGIYFYRLLSGKTLISTGKLVVAD
jgi:large repetitive protein